MDAVESHRAKTVSVSVLTFKRPKDLETILPQLLEQAAQAEVLRYRVQVVVVDNDPDGGARQQVMSLAAGRETDGQASVRYEHEPEPGISAARNRALTAALDWDLLVFIDDDERPSDHWLEDLLRTYETYGCAAVVGPVISAYDEEPEPWIAEGGFFRRRRMPTGTRIEVAGTNNLLLDMRQIREFGLRFDPKFGLIGGGDTMFTKLIIRHGGEMVWCDEAVVVDVVPTARLTRRWVVMRAYRYGTTWSLTSLLAEQSVRGRMRLRFALFSSGCARVVVGLTRWAAGVATRSLRHEARGLRTAARGAGMSLGAWGRSYEEYRRAN